MYAREVKKTISIGNSLLSSSPVTGKIIGFLYTNLPSFRSYLMNSNFSAIQELQLNQKLALFLDAQSRNFEFSSKKVSPLYFSFIKDVDLSNSHGKPDIGVFLGAKGYSSNEAFFHIECKRLPTPSSGGRSEREYVRGNNVDGGIERYKKEKHGAGLPESAMIAYIQTGNVSDWFSRINQWVNELIELNPDKEIVWSTNDMLTKPRLRSKRYFDTGAYYRSLNSRINYDTIVLHHFWIQLTN